MLRRKFSVVTNCKGLIWIFNVKDPGSKLIGLKLLLEEYEYEVKYKPGKRKFVADGLSRYPFECLVTEHNITEGKKLNIIKEMHNCPIGRHQGIQRTIERIKIYINWPNLEKYVTNYIKKCKVCQVNKESQFKSKTASNSQ